MGRGFELLGGAAIKSVQSGRITSISSLPINVTISSVDLSKSFVYIRFSTDGYRPYSEEIRARLTSSTNLEFQSGGLTPSPATTELDWFVIEFQAGVSVQRGITTIAGTSDTSVTISSVNTSKSFITITDYNNYNPGEVDTSAGWRAAGRFISSTKIALRKVVHVSDYYTYVAWEVVSFS